MKFKLIVVWVSIIVVGCHTVDDRPDELNAEQNSKNLSATSHYLLGARVFKINGEYYLDSDRFSTCLDDISPLTKVEKNYSQVQKVTIMNLSLQSIKDMKKTTGSFSGDINIGDSSDAAKVMAQIEKGIKNDSQTMVIAVSSDIITKIKFNEAPKQKYSGSECGAGYVSSANIGISFTGVIQVEFMDKYDKNSAEAKIKANISSLDVDGALKLQKILENYNMTINVSIAQIGGDSSTIFKMFSPFKPKNNDGIYYLSDINVGNMHEYANLLWEYAGEPLKNQFESNSNSMITLADAYNNFNVTYAGPTSIKTYINVVKPDYNKEILNLLSDAEINYQNLLSLILKFNRYLNVINDYDYENKRTYNKYVTDGENLLDSLHNEYRDVAESMVANNNNINIIHKLEKNLSATKSLIENIKNTKYDYVYTITGINAITPVYLVPILKSSKLPSFVTYVPIGNFAKSAYTPYISYDLKDGILEVDDNNIYTGFEPKLNFLLSGVSMSANGSIRYYEAEYFTNYNDKDTIKPNKGDELKSMFELVKYDWNNN